MSVLNLVRKELLALSPYAADNFDNKKIYLNANENPFCLPFAPECNRYPMIRPAKLIKALASYYKANEKNITVTAGSDNAIDLIIRVFCRAGKDSVLICPPTFSMYSVYAKVQNAKILEVPLKDEKLDVKNIIKTIKTKKPKVCFIPNPSAPLGVLFNQKDILTVIKSAKKTTMVVLDEAYIDFAKADSFTKYINKYPNLIVLKTLSKACAMAGARVGAAIALKEVTTVLNAVVPPYPLAAGSISTAVKLLTSSKELAKNKRNIKIILKERERMKKELKKLSFINYIYPSQTNFLFIKISKEADFFNYLLKNKIVVRCFPRYGIRITVSNKTENNCLLKAAKQYT
ncbi:Histidinol-phosphate aminotransferase [Elusimicrobium minutum Pei191]|uniref:histidinol-phosphate transaminase n=1 Tax=Elusimicrobium minutum (strain Pei191) TaxID=445932 RepID=B2KCM1_ELUMP|nr:histidinol-phosphate transaminase [Elusimicrobium minutum]ACC98267.1 Histidinol-phosphate aminotransferase [Elusimicrobium minutum Pei191]